MTDRPTPSATDAHKQPHLILDFRVQNYQPIRRSIRELGVYCEIYAWDVAFAQIEAFNPDGLILSGGPASTHTDEPGAD